LNRDKADLPEVWLTQSIEVWSRMEMGDDLYNWQSYIQESKAKKERKEEENERCARSLIYKWIRINAGL
jgi:hypothetical protein